MYRIFMTALIGHYCRTWSCSSCRKGKVKLPDISYAGKQLAGWVKVDYRPHPTVDLWDERQIQLQRFNHRIEVQVSEGEFYNVPAPATDLTLMNGIADKLATDMYIARPTPIQMQANTFQC